MTAIDALLRLSGETLPADAHPVAYQAEEALSELFRADVEVWTHDLAFDLGSCLKKPLLLEIVNERAESRYFHGVVTEVELLDADEEDRLRFRVRLEPALQALRHRVNSRIFQDKPIIAIARTIFEEAGFADHVEWQTFAEYAPRDYTVQYRETELAFVSRLFEDEGIFYFFKHSPDGHKMVVTDDTSVFNQAEGAEVVTFTLAPGILDVAAQPLKALSRRRTLRSTHVVVRDYDFEKPQQDPTGEAEAKDNWPMEVYEWPGGFVKGADGKRKADARLRSRRRDADVIRGASEAVGLRPGIPFEVHGAQEDYCNGEFVVTRLSSRGEQYPDASTKNFICHNQFDAIPANAPWAPPRKTPRPRIHGVQTAVVQGPVHDPESIHTDKYGRIKVRFHWDRVGQHDDKATCWLRVTQQQLSGSMILPRVDWEVAVAFYDGDPDRPFALGRVYNGEQPVPYALPGASATGTMKSMSSPGGAGHNEIKLSDSAGSMGFGIHAEKDLNIAIGHDKSEKVGVDEAHTVGVNMSRSVGSNQTIKVGGNQTLNVGAVASQKISGAQSISVGGNESDSSTSNLIENIGGARSYTVGANYTCINNSITVEAKSGITRTVSAVHLNASASAISDNIGGSFTETIGAVSLQLVKGTAAESVGASKTQTNAAASVHIIGGKLQYQALMTTYLVGGVHYQKVAGDYTVKAPMITLLGATGTFKGGGSEVKLGGGPIVLKGSKLAIKAATIVKMGASLKIGPG